jgi:hypothetical protein
MSEINIEDINFDINLENVEEKDTFIWEPLQPEWQSKLLCNTFVIKNCLGDGNCQFRSIETALSNAGCKTDHERLRKSLVKYINSLDNKDFFDIIQLYRIEKQNGEFIGDWDPFTIKNKRQFNNELKKPGFNFQGDHITLSLVSKALGLDIILLDNYFNITDLSNPDQLQPKVIVLYYDNKGLNATSGHYQTIGIITKRKKVYTMFKRSELPEEIDRLLDKHNFFLQHIRDICSKDLGCNKLQLNNIIKQVEDRIKTKISKHDKIKIIQIIRTILENENYFNEIKTKSTKI